MRSTSASATCGRRCSQRWARSCSRPVSRDASSGAGGGTMTGVTTGEVIAPRAALRRDLEHRVLGGVCAGLGRRMGIDPVILRVAFVVAAAAGGGGLPLYVLARVVVPAPRAGRARAPA